jgi:tRNA threonylcarbamoyladenosine biosynthesis protein TsaB
MILYINTQDQKTVSVVLKKDGEILESLSEQNEFGSQVLLPLVEKILKKNELKFRDLTGIEVATGPGSFTGLRVGVAVANALGFALGIPVNGKKIETALKYL